jgi:hypothetical protein
MWILYYYQYITYKVCKQCTVQCTRLRNQYMKLVLTNFSQKFFAWLKTYSVYHILSTVFNESHFAVYLHM